jgi:pimeloyl-ACP methyl ester carboxylesterase
MQPTLIIRGEEDQVFPMELAQEVSLVLPADYKWQGDVSNILSIAKLQFDIPHESGRVLD